RRGAEQREGYRQGKQPEERPQAGEDRADQAHDLRVGAEGRGIGEGRVEQGIHHRHSLLMLPALWTTAEGESGLISGSTHALGDPQTARSGSLRTAPRSSGRLWSIAPCLP